MLPAGAQPLRIAILSRGPRLYSTRRLKEAVEARGHSARVMNPMAFSIEVESGNPRLYYRNRGLGPVDAVIPRIGSSITFFGTAVVRQFEQMGVFCANASHAITVSRDKLRAFQVLSRHRVSIPKTLFVRHKDEILPGIERLGGPPVVIKLPEGTQGIGVILADSTRIAETIVETLSGPARQNVLLQEFVKESRGTDVRALVVGNRVVAAMRRRARGDEFRSNLHRGGRVEAVDLDPEYQRIALHAAQILGLRVAGVDLLDGADGPMVIEVNSSPGLEGVEAATGVDVAMEVVRLIEEEVLFPDFDIRQRLTLQSGYGVMEIPIDPASELCGKTIVDSQLRERDVMVLTIQRDSVTIPNPRMSREILPGDVLLCFGKMLTLRGLAPKRPVRRRRRGAPPSAATSKPPTDA